MIFFKKKRFVICVVLLITLAGFYFSWKKAQEMPFDIKKSAKPIKIGALLALTGEASAYGLGSKNVINLAVEEINKRGGIDGHPLEIIYEDSKCSAKDGVNAIRKLVQDAEIKVILGGSCSSETLAAIPLINEKHVLLFSPTASSPSLKGLSPYFFRIQPSDAIQGKVLAEFAYINKKWRKVAVLLEQLEFPKGVFDAFESTLAQLGGEVFKVEFPPATTDYRPYLIKLKSNNPDALFLDLNTTIALTRALKQIEELNWHPPLLALDIVLGNQDFVNKFSKQLEGMVAAGFDANPKNPKFQHLVEAYQKKYQAELPFPGYSQNIYDAVYLLAEGLSKVGYNSEKLAAWSRTIKNWNGASGSITIDSQGERVGTHTVKTIKNGNIVGFINFYNPYILDSIKGYNHINLVSCCHSNSALSKSAMWSQLNTSEWVWPVTQKELERFPFRSRGTL